MPEETDTEIAELKVRLAQAEQAARNWQLHWEQATVNLAKLLAAALKLCGQESDGTWVAYTDEHGDSIRDHLIPVVAELSGKPNE